jgi:DNA-binding transcriptional LysR family regulator
VDIRQLKYFISVAETLNFTESAKRLYVAQSTLSQQILNLEKQLGVKLFLRNSHAIQLTPSGMALQKEAKAIINKVNEAIQITQQAEYGIAGNLKIGFLGGSERRFLPKLIATFRRKYPKITLSCTFFDLAALDKSIYQGDVDIGFTMAVPQDKLPGLSWKLIYSDILQIVMPSHNLLDEANLKFFCLDRETFLFNTPGRGLDHLIRICSHQGIAPNINLTHDVELLFLATESGAGITILPRTVLDFYARTPLNYINIDGEDSYVNQIVAWKKSNKNLCIPLLLEELEYVTRSTDCVKSLATIDKCGML